MEAIALSVLYWLWTFCMRVLLTTPVGAGSPVAVPVCLSLPACRATPLDIFNFFDSYDIIAESLQLGVDALGRPSGEAWLTFASSDEALRAVRERNRHYLGNRYLELSLT